MQGTLLDSNAEFSLRTGIYRRTLDRKDGYLLSLRTSRSRALSSTAVIIYLLLDRHDDLTKLVNPNFEQHIYGEEAELPLEEYANLK